MKIGVIGAGWVGAATVKLFGTDNVVLYDPHIDGNHPMFHNTRIWESELSFRSSNKDDINKCPVSFVCVPTNALPDGSLDTSIVEEVVSWCESPLIVIRSTVNPGTTDYLRMKYNKRIVFQPEYLGETSHHPFSDMSTRPFVVLGGEDKDMQEVIDLYTRVYNANVNVTQLTAYEAEVCKLSENRAIGFKVMQCHELYLACKKADLNYYKIRDAVYGADPRFDLWFSFIYKDDEGNEKLGFESSKCLKKDIPAWAAWAESLGASADITRKLTEASKFWQWNYEYRVTYDSATFAATYSVTTHENGKPVIREMK